MEVAPAVLKVGAEAVSLGLGKPKLKEGTGGENAGVGVMLLMLFSTDPKTLCS